MKASTALVLGLAVVLSLSGCDTASRYSGEPSPTSLPQHLPAGAPRGEKVAVCYSASASTRETVMKAAAELCKEPGSTVDIVTEDFYLNDCPLLKKRRAVFVCHYPK
jgi:hypothetical protein